MLVAYSQDCISRSSGGEQRLQIPLGNVVSARRLVECFQPACAGWNLPTLRVVAVDLFRFHVSIVLALAS